MKKMHLQSHYIQYNVTLAFYLQLGISSLHRMNLPTAVTIPHAFKWLR